MTKKQQAPVFQPVGHRGDQPATGGNVTSQFGPATYYYVGQSYYRQLSDGTVEVYDGQSQKWVAAGKGAPPANWATTLTNNSNPPGGPPGGGSTSGGAAGPFLVTKDGVQLSKVAYDALAASFTHIARTYGVPTGAGLIRTAIENGLQPTEFQQRAIADSTIMGNKQLFNDFSATLQYEGVTKKPLSYKDQFDFVVGVGPNAWRNVWDQYATAAAATQSGVGVITGTKNVPAGQGSHVGNIETAPQQTGVGLNANQDLNLTQKQLAGFYGPQTTGANLTIAGQEKLIQAYAAIAEKTLPASRYKNYGVSKSDVVAVAAGGGTQAAKDAITRIAAEEQAFEQFRAPLANQQAFAGGSRGATLGLQGASQ